MRPTRSPERRDSLARRGRPHARIRTVERPIAPRSNGAAGRAASALAAVFLASILFVPAGRAAPGDSSAGASAGSDLLRQVAERFRGYETFEARFVQEQEWVGMDETPMYSGTLYLKRPNLFRIEYSEPAGNVQVSDGSTVWTYVPENHEVLATRLTGAPGEGGDLLRWILETGHPDPVVATGKAGDRPARILTLTPEEGLGVREVRLWVAPASPEIVQYEITDSSGNRSVYRLTEARVNPPLSDTLFRFDPPDGVPVVELGAP